MFDGESWCYYIILLLPISFILKLAFWQDDDPARVGGQLTIGLLPSLNQVSELTFQGDIGFNVLSQVNFLFAKALCLAIMNLLKKKLRYLTLPECTDSNHQFHIVLDL